MFLWCVRTCCYRVIRWCDEVFSRCSVVLSIISHRRIHVVFNMYFTLVKYCFMHVYIMWQSYWNSRKSYATFNMTPISWLIFIIQVNWIQSLKLFILIRLLHFELIMKNRNEISFDTTRIVTINNNVIKCNKPT